MAQLPEIHAVYVQHSARVTGAQRGRAFSLVDVLVSIAVMSVLMSLLLPTLQRVRETAFRVKCKGHLEQLGLAVNMYADDYLSHLPPADDGVSDRYKYSRQVPDLPLDQNQNKGLVADTMTAMVGVEEKNKSATDPMTTYKWQGLGLLYSTQYLSHPVACYCPSHHGNHPFDRYKAQWRNGNGNIVTNYQYRIPGTSSIRFELPPRTTIVTDGMMSKLDYNHIQGSNTLRVDGSVGWFEDYDASLYNSLPDDVTTDVGNKKGTKRREPNPAWRKLDDASASRHRSR